MKQRKRFNDLTGKRFSKLVAIKPVGVRHTCVEWLCICDCGSYKVTLSKYLLSAQTKSCGCLPRVKTRHGMCKTKIYDVWRSMHRRTKSILAKNATYLKKGISVCDRWGLFENFYEDMGPSYKSGLSIERINNDGNYEPGNCKWATTMEQSRNKGSNVYYTIGNETKIFTDWCKQYSIGRKTVELRMKRGLDFITALQTKVDMRYSRARNAGIKKTNPIKSKT